MGIGAKKRGLLPRSPRSLRRLPSPPPPHPDSARRLGLLQGSFYMENPKISIIRLRAGPLLSSYSPARAPSVQLADNPHRPMDSVRAPLD